jgi:hypothetical protein
MRHGGKNGGRWLGSFVVYGSSRLVMKDHHSSYVPRFISGIQSKGVYRILLPVGIGSTQVSHLPIATLRGHIAHSPIVMSFVSNWRKIFEHGQEPQMPISDCASTIKPRLDFTTIRGS